MSEERIALSPVQAYRAERLRGRVEVAQRRAEDAQRSANNAHADMADYLAVIAKESGREFQVGEVWIVEEDAEGENVNLVRKPEHEKKATPDGPGSEP